MNAWFLLKELQKALQAPLATLLLPVMGRDQNRQPLPAESGIAAMRPAAIHLGSMPPTANDALSAAPFVLLQPLEGFDDGDGIHNIRVAIRLCIVAGDLEAAENDLHNLISIIRLNILALPMGILGNGHFRLSPFAKSGGRAPWERPDEQALPFLQAHILTQWQTMGARNAPAPADCW